MWYSAVVFHWPQGSMLMCVFFTKIKLWHQSHYLITTPHIPPFFINDYGLACLETGGIILFPYFLIMNPKWLWNIGKK